MASGRAARKRGRAVQGRWSLRRARATRAADDDLADRVAGQLLARYGVVFRELAARESFAVPWRDVLRALRRREARGLVRGGRFVAGFIGEQYALPDAVDGLRRVRREERTGEIVRVRACDPLNLVGIVTPGPRVPAHHGEWLVFVDGAYDPAPPSSGRRLVAPRSRRWSRAAPLVPPSQRSPARSCRRRRRWPSGPPSVGQSASPPGPAQIDACPPLHPGWQFGLLLSPLVGQQ